MIDACMFHQYDKNLSKLYGYNISWMLGFFSGTLDFLMKLKSDLQPVYQAFIQAFLSTAIFP